MTIAIAGLTTHLQGFLQQAQAGVMAYQAGSDLLPDAGMGFFLREKLGQELVNDLDKIIERPKGIGGGKVLESAHIPMIFLPTRDVNINLRRYLWDRDTGS
jgi:hypothetical protein